MPRTEARGTPPTSGPPPCRSARKSETARGGGAERHLPGVRQADAEDERPLLPQRAEDTRHVRRAAGRQDPRADSPADPFQRPSPHLDADHA